MFDILKYFFKSFREPFIIFPNKHHSVQLVLMDKCRMDGGVYANLGLEQSMLRHSRDETIRASS